MGWGSKVEQMVTDATDIGYDIFMQREKSKQDLEKQQAQIEGQRATQERAAQIQFGLFQTKTQTMTTIGIGLVVVAVVFMVIRKL